MLTLRRGIAVPEDQADSVYESIRSGGIRGDEGSWDIRIEDLRDRADALFRKPSLTTIDTRGERLNAYQTVCACGDELGASYYALIHNTHRDANELSYIIEFTAAVDCVSVDGKDFLYTCFQFWDKESTDYYEAQATTLTRLFGPYVLKYFQKAANRQDQQFRMAMCDLACQDPEVVLAHARNRSTIGGRHGVRFASAFSVKVPIQPIEILNVSLARRHEFTPEITLGDFVRGKL